jgi:hypothetical protein
MPCATVNRRFRTGKVSEILSLRATALPVAQIVVAGGDFPGSRHESIYDKRWLDLIPDRPALTKRCAGRTRNLVRVVRTHPRAARWPLSPQRRPARRGDSRRLAGFTDVLENLLHGGRLVDEGYDAHLGVADRAEQRECVIDARQKHGPQLAHHRTMAGFRVIHRRSRCRRYGGKGQRRYRRTLWHIGCQHAVVTIAIRSWPWHQDSAPVDQFQRRQHQITGPVGALLRSLIDQMFWHPAAPC